MENVDDGDKAKVFAIVELWQEESFLLVATKKLLVKGISSTFCN